MNSGIEFPMGEVIDLVAHALRGELAGRISEEPASKCPVPPEPIFQSNGLNFGRAGLGEVFKETDCEWVDSLSF
jgi:hypothetical protein